MKKLIFVIIVVLLISANLQSQTGWIVYNTSMNAFKNDVKFINANTGFIVGDTNFVYKSTDGGLNWASYTVPLSYPASIKVVSFLNENTGFAGGGHHWDEYHYSKYLFKTTNCGETWLRIFYDTLYAMNGAIVNIIPFNENEIIVSSSGNIEVSAIGGIYKSTNGGVNFNYKGLGGSCYSICFLNSNTGYASNGNTNDFQPPVTKLFKTTDGCTSWTLLHRDSAQGISSGFSKIQVFDENNVYALNSYYSAGINSTRFFKSTNGGSNWNYTQENHQRYYTMYFINPSTGWIGGYWGTDSSAISYTTNGGNSWMFQKKNFNVTVKRIFFFNETKGWALLNFDKRIMRTTTAGVTFVSTINDVIPDKYSLFQNYPNPFNPISNIKYKISKSSNVKITVFDVSGKEVEILVNEKHSPGEYLVTFDGSTLNSGVYFYRMITDGFSETKRMILIK